MGCGHVGQLLGPVGVEDLPALAVLLQLDLVFQLLAGQVLVHEALAVQIQIQEACVAHDAHTGQVGTAAHMVDHGCVALLHLSACPHAQLDAVALIGEAALHVHIGEQALDVVLNDFGAEMLQHLGVLGVIAGGQDDALGGVALDVLAGGSIAGIQAHAAAVLHDELFHKAAVEGVHVAGVNGLLHVGIDGDGLVGQELHGGGVAGEALLLPVVVLGQRVENGDQEVVCVLVRDGAAGGLGVVQLRVCFHPPVKDIADVVSPLAHNGALAAVGAFHHVRVHDLVDLLTSPGVAAPLSLHIAVDDGILAAAALGTVSLFKGCHLAAVLGDAAHGCHTGNAAAHHGHIHVHRLGDLALVDLRLGAQPVVLRSGSGAVCAVCLDAHGLLDAAGSRLLDGIGGDGSAGDVIDLGTLCGHDGLLQGGCGHAADALGLVGSIDDHLGDGGLAEGHGHLHLTDAGGRAGVGTGGVDGIAGSGGAGRSCGVAGSQCTGGNTAHGGSGGDLQKAFAGDLFHLDFLFLLINFSSSLREFFPRRT